MTQDHSLTGVRLLHGCTADEAQSFEAAGARRSVPAGHVFFRMGDGNSSLFVILAGSAKVERLGVAENVQLAICPRKEATALEKAVYRGWLRQPWKPPKPDKKAR